MPNTSPRPATRVRRRSRWIWAIAVLAGLWLIDIGVHFPYESDRPLTPSEVKTNVDYYARLYPQDTAADNADARYEEIGKAAADSAHIEDRIRRFARDYRLSDAAVLDVGSGRGYLQDIVPNYTGLDITPNLRTRYHKRFVVGSATSMPFEDNAFGAAWSVWVLEHVPNPEQMLSEMRRVVRPGGMIYLEPAWNCMWWFADGYPVRPYSDFGWGGRWVKATLPIRSHPWFVHSYSAPIRYVRAAFERSGLGEHRLHYRRLTPSAGEYWMPDSDAVNSLTPQEVVMWFESRGDECVNCTYLAGVARSPAPTGELIIRVRKRQ